MTLPSPRTTAGAAALARIVAAPSSAVLAFDFDGTLAPVVPDPRDARAHPRAAPLLRALSPLVRSIAVVTGRPAERAVEYGGLDSVPGIVVLGQYGRERWEGGVLSAPDPSPGVQQARDALPELLKDLEAPEGIWVEDKGQALAVHTRRTADPEAALDLVGTPLAELASETGLLVEPGRLVIELRPGGADKGVALAGFVAEQGAESVLYTGDDLGDVAAFDAVERLRLGTVAGITVCSGSAEVRGLAERADLVVDGPDGVVELLAELAAALDGGRPG
ncbi:trehalose 6-phosphatase [Murinocardiopsis flavida]|uniref:Trehalose 6-phosphate phosphatase n=1 Tax=Murinocardiopsis flavida TaxID=645275 RepID=A0A2P8DR45_9ACTN|nr:trehalose-phosphatase [Murinocardiopsis flavida]PSK99654.1 trehalose 6-phosphatase [Murinocardiopsis flavida]